MKIWRINLIYFLFVFFTLIIITRLVFLQIINGELNRALAKGQQEIFQEISGARGEIFLYDKDALVPVATNKSSQLCYAVPKLIEDDERIAQLLAPILDLEEEEILEAIKDKDRLFSQLKREVSAEKVDEIIKLELKGIGLREEPLRFYPDDSLASDVLGFVNKNGEGQYGIEGYWDDNLTGRGGWQRIEYGPFGRFLEGDTAAMTRGADLILTIDRNIQSQAEGLLGSYTERFDFQGGQIIVLEPLTGRILALADFPSFNPNEYEKYAESKEIEIFQNKSIQGLYEPGSVFKVVTMAAALNEEKITPETTYVDRGYVVISGEKISNYNEKVWGERTMTEVLERSINTGAVFAESQLNHNIFTDYLQRFGIFEKTNIGLQGEVYSENKEFKKGWEINFATASFGQGIEMNLLQIARAYCAIANKGKLIQPYLVEKIIKNGITEELKRDDSPKQIITPNTASQVTKMLVSVAENGYSKPARVPGYYIAGKTGTSQIPFSVLGMNQSGYSDQTWQTFIGFAPAFEPKFVIAIKLDNPNTKTASESTSLIFKDLAKYILDYYKIPPDREF